MKLLRRHSSKNATHIDVIIYLEELSPWPAHHGALRVQFTRGKRSGQTKTIAYPDDDSVPVACYHFNDTLTIPATLYRTSPNDQTYEEKNVNLFIAQVDEKGKELNVLGGLELNLAEFVHLKGPGIRQTYPIQTSASVLDISGGRPSITLSIGVAREGENAAEIAQALSTLAFDMQALPSTLSSNSTTTTTTATEQGSRQASRGEGLANSSLPSPQRHNTAVTAARAAEPHTHTHQPLPSAENSAVGPTTAVGSVAAGGHDNRREAVYDSDGFLKDDDDEYTSSSSSGGGRNSENNEGEGEETEDTNDVSAVKRNLGEEIDNAGAVDPGEVSSPVVGGRGGGGLSPATTPTRGRFSRAGETPALGSRRWAWRQQQQQQSPQLPGSASGSADIPPPSSSPPPAAPASSSSRTSNLPHHPDDPLFGRPGSNLASPPGSPIDLANNNAPAVVAALVAAANSVTRTHPHHIDSVHSSTRAPPTAMNGHNPTTQTPPRSPGTASSLTAALEKELTVAAALEVSVFLAGRGWSRASGAGGGGSAPRACTQGRRVTSACA